jgi:RNA-directed DNA polymerase
MHRKKSSHSAACRPNWLRPLKCISQTIFFLNAIEPIWEADFSQRSYGFRPNRSTYDAISYLSNRLTGNGQIYQWVIEGDIASYFDTIPHRKVLKEINKRVADRNIRELLWKFLRAGVMYKDEHSETLTGTSQGGLITLPTKLPTCR